MVRLTLPQPPPDEMASVKQRILRKYEAYLLRRDARTANDTELDGERYEIAAAVHLYLQRRLVDGTHLSRWERPGEASGSQKIWMGHNNEYDFLLGELGGVLLGDAKSYTSGLGPYTKKLVSFCLMDSLIDKGVNRILGFCFVCPAVNPMLVRSTVANAIGILSGYAEGSGAAGMDSQQVPLAMKLHFRRYTRNNRAPQPNELTEPIEHYLEELAVLAGFRVEFMVVPLLHDEALERQMERLASKERFRAQIAGG